MRQRKRRGGETERIREREDERMIKKGRQEKEEKRSKGDTHEKM